LSRFEHDEARVAIDDAARLLGRSCGEIAEAIEDGEIEATSGCGGPRIGIQELAEQAVHVWPIDAIEEALGRDAALILPAGVRTRRFTARLPRYVVAALKCLAEENGESAGALLTRDLHGLAYAHRERLGASIAGFAEAVNWPVRKRQRRGSRTECASRTANRRRQEGTRTANWNVGGLREAKIWLREAMICLREAKI
jgi:hypothetical protein